MPRTEAWVQATEVQRKPLQVLRQQAKNITTSVQNTLIPQQHVRSTIVLAQSSCTSATHGQGQASCNGRTLAHRPTYLRPLPRTRTENYRTRHDSSVFTCQRLFTHRLNGVFAGQTVFFTQDTPSCKSGKGKSQMRG